MKPPTRYLQRIPSREWTHIPPNGNRKIIDSKVIFDGIFKVSPHQLQHKCGTALIIEWSNWDYVTPYNRIEGKGPYKVA